jgi:hypothetical protein
MEALFFVDRFIAEKKTPKIGNKSYTYICAKKTKKTGSIE